MNSALRPREIQARLRAGASVPEVAAQAGVDVDKISGFAIPVMAERAHMTRTALASSVRRRGDGSGHRRLGEIIEERLRARSLDADTVEWDSWRQNDLKWRLVGMFDDQAASRAAEFIFDPKGRFSVADNADARWMIGEELPGPVNDPDNENTIDFHDEFALVRATSGDSSFGTTALGKPGDDVPPMESPYEHSAHTSELDELYDMLSGVSEDSVRIYLGLEDSEGEESTEDDVRSADSKEGSSPGAAASADDDPESESSLAEALSDHPDLPVDQEEAPVRSSAPDTGVDAGQGPAAPQEQAADVAVEPQVESLPDVPQDPDAPHRTPSPSAAVPEQDPLLPDTQPEAPKRTPNRKRASIPSWDEIMFGGPSRN
ncbi:MAG: septation protein SepH [Propionibacteriaceae bacterium]|nr:septation protein SepH [Propionibacteriaceae bacterium]